MYKSLKNWMNVPVIIRPFLLQNTAGDVTFGTDVTVLCLPEGKIRRIVDYTGKEVVSNSTLYFDASIIIDIKDKIVFEGKVAVIKNINTFYEHSTSNIRVVYL